jgi:hypothetical protein
MSIYNRLLKALSFLILSLTAVFFSCAQTKSIISKARLVYYMPATGNIRVDSNGEPITVKIDTVFTVYVESSTRNITWLNAIGNGRQYKIYSNVITQTPVKAGLQKSNNQLLFIQPSAGFILWELRLLPLNNTPALQNTTTPWVLQSIFKGKIINTPVNQITALTPAPAF